MIFDCHTHRFPATSPLCPDADDRWLPTLDACGVTHCVALPYAGLYDASVVPAENDAIASFSAQRPGRLLPFFTVNSRDPALAEAEFLRCAEQLGCRGVKLHPWLQAVSLQWPVIDVVCELAGRYDLPVLIHDGTPCFALPSQIALLARRHPRTRFILGHCGLLEHWREAIDALNSTENLWGCMCGPHLEATHELMRRCDRGRLLWGSDFGFVSAHGVSYRLQLLEQATGGGATFEAILETNPLELFRITRPATPRAGVAAAPKWLAGRVCDWEPDSIKQEEG